MKNMKSLKLRAKEFEVLLPFMEDKEKGDFKSLKGEAITINEYGFLKDAKTNEEYVCFTIIEHDEFYFGGKVLTENMREFEDEGYHDLIVKEKLPVLFDEKMSKNKRTYTTVKFYPEG